ncbi:MAG TPA: hypothetical protein VK835_02715 [Bacteroidia bacterium]|jgi:hypothetical protein|nr:hypothetical protein [Bacteroidia bacterium]
MYIIKNHSGMASVAERKKEFQKSIIQSKSPNTALQLNRERTP